MARSRTDVCNSSDSLQRSSQFFAATLISFWLTVHQSFAQSQQTAFGQFRAFPIPERFERMLPYSRSGSPRTALLWNGGSHKLVVAEIDSSLLELRTRALRTAAPFDEIVVADLDGDKKPELLLIDKSAKKISLVVETDPDSLRSLGSLSLAVTPTGVIVGDINNDRRPDILVFDRDNPGIIPFIGTGKTQFRQGVTIAPDTPVGILLFVHLNNDDIIDLAAYDWVRSELHLLYGVGQGKFLDQMNIPLEGDLRELVAAQLAPQGSLDFVARLLRPASMQVWEGDGLGDFRLRSRIPFKEPALAIGVADLNSDGYKDLVTLDRPPAFRVYLNTSDELGSEQIDFSAGTDPHQLGLQDVDADSSADALVLDRDGRRLLLYRAASQAGVLKDSLEFVTGVRPRGIVMEDLNGDGLKDIALLNGGSNSLSMFLNRRDLGLMGQMSYSVAANPRYLEFHSSSDSTARFIVSYPQTKQLSFLTIDHRDQSTINAVIATAGEGELLSWSKGENEEMRFFCYNSTTVSGSPSLTLFQELGSLRFIERSFRLTIPNALLGAAVAHLNNDGFPDVAYFFRNSTGKYEFAVSLGDSVLSFRQKVFSYELPDEVIQKSYIWAHDVDQDGAMDLLFSLPQPQEMLKLVRGKGDGTYSLPDTVAASIRITDRSQVRILDLDGDGVVDIAVNVAHRGSIEWLKGKGGAKFEDARHLASAPRIGHFAFGDLNGDGVVDLALTLTEKGTMKLYDGRMLFRGPGHEPPQ